jgi:hypothetical protein
MNQDRWLHTGLSWREWKLSDIIYGIIVPIVVLMVIVGLSRLGSLIGLEAFGAVIGIISGIEEMVVIVGVPMLLGLVWNRWAGGASGFIVGSLYALYWADQFNRGYTFGVHASAGTLLLGYIVSAMFIGYAAGALNKHSEDFKRILISGLAAGTIGGLLIFGTFQLSPANVVTGFDGFLLTVLPRVACGAIIPVVAKVFMWYGMAMNRKTNL